MMSHRMPLIGVREGRDIRSALRPKLAMHRKVNLIAGQVERIQISGTEVAKLVLSVIQGSCDLYVGEVGAIAFPDARFASPIVEEVCFPIVGQVLSIVPTPGVA